MYVFSVLTNLLYIYMCVAHMAIISDQKNNNQTPTPINKKIEKLKVNENKLIEEMKERETKGDEKDTIKCK